MKKITKVVITDEKGREETFEGIGTSHLFRTGMKDDKKHTMSYLNVVLVPRAAENA